MTYYTQPRGNEIRSFDISDPTSGKAERLAYFESRIAMVEEACNSADPTISDFLLEAVTTDATFPTFEARGVPFGRDLFYDRLHRFFYILDRLRK